MSRPLLLATIICMATNPKAAQAKIKMIIMTFQFLVLSKDKKWKKPEEDPASFFKEGEDEGVESKTVIFLRHGESTWNWTFNKGDRKTGKFLLDFVPGLIKSFGTEWYFLVSGKSDESWFYDSPLSKKGISQAEAVKKYLRDTNPEFSTPKEANLIKLMKGEGDEKCQMISSNLRRAISTLAIALQDRLDKKADDKILILSELQEASINPDAQSIHPPKSPLVTSWIDSDRTKEIYRKQCDTSMNTGNKAITSNGLLRMQRFCDILFEEVDSPNAFVTGHSYWFRAFFQTYLPKEFEHVSKKKKLINGGVAGFTLKRKKTKNGYKYLIDHNSLTVLYGGF
jgi:phosphohistidine phosphatase SixA